MTVCIATICQYPAPPVPGAPVSPVLPIIVCASDRMITAGGDVEYEPEVTKVFRFLPSIAAIVSGDWNAQFEICLRTQSQVRSNRIDDVDGVAQAYAHEFAALRRRRGEQAHLAPLGLDTERFVERSGRMSPRLVEQITVMLRQSVMDDEVIIAGMDARGPHIYVVSDPGVAVVHTGVGFAAVGIGARHAESQFMFSRYAKQWPFVRAILLTYMAKKRAQTAPGVGEFTDMFTVGPPPLPIRPMPPEFVNELEQIYQDIRTKAGQAEEEGHSRLETRFEEMMMQAAAQQFQQAAAAVRPPDPSPEAPPSSGGTDQGVF